MFKLVGVLFFSYCNVVLAEPTSGNKLYENLNEGKKIERSQPHSAFKAGLGYGFVIGLREMDSLQSGTFCIPDEVTNGQLFDVVLNYLEKNPESRHKSGAILASLAIWEGFPCADNKSRTVR